jgi:hypothetical protein
MEKTWKPTTAGILTIIGGIFGIVVGCAAAFVGGILSLIPGLQFMGAIGGGLLALGIIALIGGIVALRKRVWGLALVGAICAMFPIVPLGILAIIFVSMGKKEFGKPQPQPS